MYEDNSGKYNNNKNTRKKREKKQPTAQAYIHTYI